MLSVVLPAVVCGMLFAWVTVEVFHAYREQRRRARM